MDPYSKTPGADGLKARDRGRDAAARTGWYRYGPPEGVRSRKAVMDLEDLLRALKIPAVLLGADETVIIVNKAFERMSGFLRREFEGKDEGTRLFQRLLPSMTPPVNGVSFKDHPCQLVDRKGDRKTVLVSRHSLAEGALLVTFVDITKWMDAGIREKKEKDTFRSGLVKAPYGVIILDDKARNIFINAEFTAITGYGLEDIPTGKDWLVRAYPDDGYRESVVDSWRKAIAGKDVTDGVFSVRCKTGEIKEVEFRAAGLEGNRTMAMVSDLTRSRATEKTLRESEQKFRALFEGSRDATFLYDGRVFVDCNRAAIEMMGCADKGVLLNRRPSDLSPARQPDGLLSTRKAREITDTCFRTGSFRFEWVHRRMDGTDFPVEVLLTSIPVDGKKVFHCVWRDITERKKAEERLRFSQFAVDTSKDPIFWVNREARFVHVNEAASEVLGYTHAELLSMAVPDIDPNFTMERWNESWTLTGRRGSTTFESAHRSKDGTVHPVEVSSNHLTFNNDEYACVIVRDITERRQAEDALKESESKFRSLAEKTPVGVYLLQDDRFVYLNPAFAKVLGYEVSAIPPEWRPEDIVFPEDRAVVTESIRKKLSGEVEATHSEFRAVTGDRRLITVEAHGSRTIYRGRPAVIGTLLDISERKRAEMALRESEERFHQLFEQNEDALVIFRSGTGEILDANPAAVSLYGYRRGALAKHGASLIFPPPELRRFENILKSAGKTRSFALENMQTIAKGGMSLRVNIRGKTITLSDADVVYCAFRDMTEEIRLKEEAARLHSKLIHANKMTSLGVLVSSVAHEVNNPNNFIMFNASLLADAWQDALRVLAEYSSENGEFSLGGLPFSEMRSVVARLLQGITDGSRRIKGIVDNLKDFARQDNTGLTDRVDMNKVVSDSTMLLASQIKRHTSTFSLELAPDLPAVKGNFQQLEQVIINLVMNALQSLPDPGRGIRVTTLLDPDRGHVRVVVRDEGIGMSGEVMKKITEPFFTTKLATGGTGLGLSISHSIIKDHSGFMEFESQPDRGTTAVVRIPVI